MAEHPPHSPELKLIEHLWTAINSMFGKDHVYLKDLKKNAERRVIFIVVRKATYWAVHHVLIDSLTNSMPRHYYVVGRNRGRYTKY